MLNLTQSLPKKNPHSQKRLSVFTKKKWEMKDLKDFIGGRDRDLLYMTVQLANRNFNLCILFLMTDPFWFHTAPLFQMKMCQKLQFCDYSSNRKWLAGQWTARMWLIWEKFKDIEVFAIYKRDKRKHLISNSKVKPMKWLNNFAICVRCVESID